MKFYSSILAFALLQQVQATVANINIDASVDETRERNFLRRNTQVVENANEIISETKTSVDDHGKRYVVHFKADLDHETCLNKLKNYPSEKLEIVHKLHSSKSYAIKIVDPKDYETVGSLQAEPCFDITEDVVRVPMYLKDSIQMEDEKDRHLQFWKAQDVPYGIEMVKAQKVWDEYGTRGSGVKVCVMDTGIQANHEDFIPSKLSGYSGREAVTPWDADGNGHGTHVSGTIGAADNNDGVVGVSPEVEIYTVRVFDNSGYFFGSDVVAAAEACRDAGAKIISMSLGGPSYNGDEKDIFEELFNQGILSIAAAGNDGDDDYSFPASYEKVMSVAAVNDNRNHASFSQYNDRVDIAAPGVNVRSTWNNGRYSSISGTSMATPHVSGVAALLLSKMPTATPQQLWNVMTSTSNNPNSNGRDDYYGWGIVSAYDSMVALVNGDTGGPGNTNPVPPPTQECNPNQVALEFTITTDSYGYETSWKLTNDNNGSIIDQVNENGLGNNQAITTQKCLAPSACYTLTIYDSYGDGICCGQLDNVGFVVKVDGSVVKQNEAFTNEIAISNLGRGCGGGGPPTQPTPTLPPNPAPVTPPTPAPVTPPTNPPVAPPTEPQECCFLIWCWSC